jgi:DNA replication licensing factor MCM6
MPRSIEIILRDSLVERAKPGDSVIVTGYLCAAPQVYCMRLPGEKAQAVKEQIGKRSEVYSGGVSGLRGLGIRDLSYKLIFVASSIYPRNSVMQSVEAMEDDNPDLKYSFDQAKYMKKALERFSPADREIIRQIAEDPDRYRKLANSLFPDIFGHHEIKKAIILQLFSGVHKDTDQKLRLRGDLNILVVGDPSTAKSQFLKITAEFMPRSIYSNGKTSSSAGLTASVTKDINGDYAIQAGALVLADNGVCCID